MDRYLAQPEKRSPSCTCRDSGDFDSVSGSTIDKLTMLQTSIQDKTQRLVRTSREPVKAPGDSKAPSITPMSLPDYWNSDVLPPHSKHAIIELDAASSEYSKVLNIFNRTMSGYDILSIKRIQNLALWNFFNVQADHMRKKNSGNANEQILFHGTDSNHIDAVCQENFDWQICGTHGTAYGKRSYFTRDASYSNTFTEPARTKSMFACRVLVGEYTKGRHDYVRPPAKEDNSSLLYDSCVDNVFNPSIFVVFEKHQAYPEYLIQYAWRRPNMYLPHPRLYRCPHPHPDMCLAPKPKQVLPPTTKHVPPPMAKHVPSPTPNHVPPPTTKHVPPPTTKHVPPPMAEHVPSPTPNHVPPPTTKHVPPPLSRHVPSPTTKHVPPPTTKHVPPPTPNHVPPPTTKHVPPPTTKHVPPPTTKHVPPPTTKHVPPPTPSHVPPPLSRHVHPPTPSYVPLSTPIHVPLSTPIHVHPPTPKHVHLSTPRHVPPPLSKHVPPPTPKNVPSPTPSRVPPPTTKHVPPPTSRHGGRPSVASDAMAQWSVSHGGSKNTTQLSSPKSQPQRVSDLINYFHKLTNQQ